MTATRILVTGGAGFIGSHLVEALQAADHAPLVVDNLATGRRDSVPAGTPFHEISIADLPALEKAFAEARPEVVVHCAAAYKDPDAWNEDILTNAVGTANVVKLALAHGARRLVYFQTALCYGNRPLEQPISLDHPLFPESSYAISKTAGEHYIAISGLDFVSLRLANVYGPRNVSGPIPTFWQRLTEGKSCFTVNTRRDFVYVADLVEVALKAIAGEGAPGYYHVSSGSDSSIKEVYDAVTAAMGRTDPVDERERGADDAETILLDPAKTEATFAWKTRTPLTEGVASAVAWYEQHGVGETYTHLRMKD